MSITPNQVKNAFIVEGANPEEISYTRYSTGTLQPIPLIISNSSTVFGIQFYPTGSDEGLLFFKEDNTTVDKNSPVTLQKLSGSNVSSIKLLVAVNTSTFDITPLTSKAYDVSFNIVAVTASIATGTGTSTTGTSTTGGTSSTGGGGSTGTSGEQDEIFGRRIGGGGLPLSGGGINVT